MFVNFRFVLPSTILVATILSGGCSVSENGSKAEDNSIKPSVNTERESNSTTTFDSKSSVNTPSQNENEIASEIVTTTADRSRLTRFLQSVYDGKMDFVRSHLESHPEDIDASNADSRTALMLASFAGHQSLVQLLLDKGANVDLADQSGRTALMYSSTGNNVDIVKMLLKHSANVNAVDKIESWTPLMFASSEGKVRIVQALLEHGADRNAKDVDGEDSILFAKTKGHADVVWLLENFETKK